MEKISFDNFTINIDISGNLEFSTKFLFQLLFSNVVSKLHIINYTILDIEKIINECKAEVKTNSQIHETDFQDKIKILKNISKNISSIEKYAKDLTKDEYLFIIGGERLLNYSKTKPIFKTKYFDLKTKFILWKKGIGIILLKKLTDYLLECKIDCRVLLSILVLIAAAVRLFWIH